MTDAAIPSKPVKPAIVAYEEPSTQVPTVHTSASAPAPVVEIELMLSLEMFIDTVTLHLPLQALKAGLRAWMRLKHYDPDGYYPLKVWRGYLQQTLAHSG